MDHSEEGKQTEEKSGGPVWWKLAPGDSLGLYIVEERISHDNYICTYRVNDSSGSSFTAKVLSPEVSIILKDDLLRLTSLQHKYLAKTIECFEDEDRTVIISELVHGSDLRSRINRLKSIDMVSSLEIAVKTAECLAYLRDRGIVHTDLNPENIIFTEYEDIKIIDPISTPLALKKLTVLKMNPERIAYLPPETIFNSDSGGREDIYYFGGILYLLLTGKDPYSNLSPARILAAKRAKDPVKPRRLNKSIDKNLEEVILRCMNRDIEQRFGSYEEILDLLKKALGNYKIQSLKQRPETKKNIVKAALIAVAFAAVILSIALIFFPRHDVRKSVISASVKFEARRTDPWGNVIPFSIYDMGTVYSNDGFRVSVKPGSPMFVAVLNISPGGQISSLLPDDNDAVFRYIGKDVDSIFPSEKKWYRFDESAGEEIIYIIFSSKEWLQLSNFVRENPLSKMAGRAAASKVMSMLEENIRVQKSLESGWSPVKPADINDKTTVFNIRGNERVVYKVKLNHK